MLNLGQLHQLIETYPDAYHAPVEGFSLRGYNFTDSYGPAMMGVVNLSSDSWYRESVCMNTEAAIRRGLRLHAEGAALVDLGAESTILDADRVGASDQESQLLPVIKTLSQQGVRCSVETYHPRVAESALKAGAAVLNLTAGGDVKAFFKLAVQYDAGVVLCFVAGENVREVEELHLQKDHTQVLLDYFAPKVEQAKSLGLNRLWIDPGMGFYYKNLKDSAERVRYQTQTFLNTFRLRELGAPVCHALPHAFEYFEEEVRCAEPYFAVLATLGKASLLRTHEIARVRGVIESMKII